MYPKNIFAFICFLLPFTQMAALTDHEIVSSWWAKASLERSNEARAGSAILELLSTAQSERQKTNRVAWEQMNAAEACNLIAAPNGTTISVLHNIKQQSGLSLMGELYLAKSLLHSETNIEILRRRQAIITALSSNSTLFNSCHAIKETYGNSVERAISLHTVNQNEITKHCFSERSLSWFGKKNGLAIPSFLDGALYNGIITLQSALSLQHIINGVRNYPTTIAQCQQGGMTLSNFWKCAQLGSHIGGNLGTLIVFALRCDIPLKKLYEYQDLKKISGNIYQAYHDILEAAYAIHHLSEEYPVLLHMETLTHINIFEQAIEDNKDLKRCVQLIKAGPDSLWAHEQQTLITLLEEHKNAFAGIFELIAEFETYLALTQLKQNLNARSIPFCLVTFNENSAPYLNLTRFWNPLLDANKAIPNSLQLDQPHHHMILTGSNTGGKSTLIKACLANLILAQTYGISFADAMTVTPFEHIVASLNIIDNTALGASLFLSEINRAKQMLDIAHTGAKCFIACDELFTGTAAANAGRAVAGVLQKIAQEPQSISIFATHHGEVVTNLGVQQPFFNMKIDTARASDGSIKHMYQCVPGISTENIADDLLKAHLGV